MTARAGRHAGKRLSPWRVTLAVSALAAAVVAAVVVPFVVGRSTAGETAPLGPRWFGGYVDVTAAPDTELPGGPAGSPQNLLLSFVVAAGADDCAPSWGGYHDLDEAAAALDLDRRIARVRQGGSDVAVSLGGALNTELAVACTDIDELTAAYRAVIDRYDLSLIDLDLERDNLADGQAGYRRAQAIAALQEERASTEHPLQVWLTLPVGTEGLTEDGLAAAEQLYVAGVHLAGVNVMTMDFGVDLGGRSMSAAAIAALHATHDQLARLTGRYDVDLPAGDVWSILGATPMIGQNDVAGEVFTVDDATALNAFANAQGMARMSMWSLGRDRTCGPNYPDIRVVSDACSGVDQGDASFAEILATGFTDAADASPSDGPSPTSTPRVQVTDDPGTSPYPVWTERSSYSTGVKVVWHGNVYVAKWWTRGDPEPDDPTLTSAETAWTLIGPVLPGEAPYAPPTLPPGTYPEWTPDVVYQAEETVLRDGIPFVAQWWNQGADPIEALTDHDRAPWRMLTPTS